jgi:acyl phosphate:glycerol-3-phosphate acyltransferase
MSFINNTVWLLIAYLIGSIPTAYLVGKRVKGIDIREHGSGNVGATNVFRVMGKEWGAFVLTVDVIKGLAVTTLLAISANAFWDLALPLKQLLFGAAAIAGHTWSLWLKLKGGKGVATAAGALLGIFPYAALFAVLVWGGVFVVKRYVSLASMIAAGSFPILLILFHRHIPSFWTIFLISLVLTMVLIYNHRANIERLKAGTEHQVELFKKKES